MRRVLIVYLAAYYLLIAGAIVTIWRSGLIANLPGVWTIAAIVLAAALGALLWAAMRK